MPTYRAYNDVWNSSDGVHWTKVTDKAPWHPRIWFSALCLQKPHVGLGRLVEPTVAELERRWYSADGANWKQLPTETVWSKRHEHSAYVFADKIWVVGGNRWPCDNQVWQINVPYQKSCHEEGNSLSNPGAAVGRGKYTQRAEDSVGIQEQRPDGKGFKGECNEKDLTLLALFRGCRTGPRTGF